MNKLHSMLKLCLVTNFKQQSPQEYHARILQAVRGGVTMVQLREKNQDLPAIRQRAIEIQKILRPFSVPLIINDYVKLAAEINADGVHIGQTDMSPAAARKILGPNKIIGLSIENLTELKESNKIDKLDYVTASAVFPSKTKPDCKTIWGLEGLSKIIQHSKHPVTAIGGITHENIKEIIYSGAHGVAVIGAIDDYSAPYAAALRLSELIDSSFNQQQQRTIMRIK